MPTVVSREQWLAARLDLLAREKAHTREREALAAARRDLPWVRIDTDYRFHDGEGEHTLADLFAGRSQLVVYHFMFGPDAKVGCPICSFWVDNLDGLDVHLAARDVTLVLVSRAPWERLHAYRERMGWTLPWYSSQASTFNLDFQVSFTREQLRSGEATYNYAPGGSRGTEAPGLSVFARDEAGDGFHTYSTYSRGLDVLNSAYHLLDRVPRGRDEDELPFSMAWVRRRDQYPG